MKKIIIVLVLLISGAQARTANEWEAYLKSQNVVSSCEDLGQHAVYKKNCKINIGVVYLDDFRATLSTYKGNIEKQCIDFLALEIKDMKKLEAHAAVAKQVTLMTGSSDFTVEYNYGGGKNAAISYSETFGSEYACTIIDVRTNK